MSNKTPSDSPVSNITSMPTDESATPAVEKKPNAAKRAYRKIKSTPPKTAIAIVGGVALVTAGAMLGRKTAPLHLEVVDSDFDVEPMFVTPETEESDDTVN
jgi:hypothetical protein